MEDKSNQHTKHRELNVSELKAVCDPESLPCETTSELEALGEMIGQDRASRAIQLGLGMKSFGYNLLLVSKFPNDMFLSFLCLIHTHLFPAYANVQLCLGAK